MDEHIHPAITNGLRLKSINVVTAQEAQMFGVSDEEHLRFASQNERVLFTHDTDFLKLHAQGFAHAGIAFTHQRTSIGQAIRSLTLVYEVLQPEEIVGQVEFL